ncbi:YcaO-like family protein [Yersinia bercovieri]|uniref:YcaO-like family protein n=1 Tax=Yersinia bercovieri TaxID=634 RepID=UPI001CFDCE97|nr:YcaO-like family protein [Yersinia bercovieri]MCB5302587.1 YcaO-like family protein [Yersinia bercovieri]
MELPYEREITLAEAQKRILTEFQGNSMIPYIENLGQNIITTTCDIYDHNNKLLSQGVGKGIDGAALIGSFYEAFEHYISTSYQKFGEISLCKTNKLQHTLKEYDFVRSLLQTQPDTKIGCRHYRNITGDISVFYPVAFSTPDYANSPIEGDDFDYQVLRRYSSNSGTAIGSSFQEATLHAVNESIEREDISQFLINYFYQESDDELRRVNRDSLQQELHHLWCHAEAEIADQITVLEISHSCVCRTFIAFGHKPCQAIHLFGAGTSLSPYYALSRAITELVQFHSIATRYPHLIETQHHYLRRLSPWPKLRRSCKADLPGLLADRTLQAVDILEDEPITSVIDQLLHIERGLNAQGHPVLISILYQSAAGCTVTHVLIPGFERFFLINSGNIVVPWLGYQYQNS